MTATARVQAALAHERPDRLPRYEIFLPGFVEAWRTRHPHLPDPYAHYTTIDIGRILASQEGPFPARKAIHESDDHRDVRDSWGRLTRHPRHGQLFQVLETAVAEKRSLDRLTFEDPRDPERGDVRALREASRRCAARFARVSGVMGLFMPCYYLRGEERFLLDLAEDPSFCHDLIARVAAFLTGLGECVLAATNTWDTALWVYDDFGSNTGPLISPRMFETFFLEPYRRMIAYWKACGATNVVLHYDANCWAVLEMFVEAGFTALQGVYPGAGMTIPAVKERYGERLALIGGICNVGVLRTGPRDAIGRSVEEIADAGRDGGVIIGAHSIDRDIPLAHYRWYHEALARVDRTW